MKCKTLFHATRFRLFSFEPQDWSLTVLLGRKAKSDLRSYFKVDHQHPYGVLSKTCILIVFHDAIARIALPH